MNLSIEHIDRMIQDLVRLRIEMTSPDQAYFLLLTHVVAVTGVPAEDILSRKRHQPITEARCLFIYEMYAMGYTKLSISRRLGLDHVAVLEQIKKYKRFCEIDLDFREMATKLKESWKTHSSTL